MQGGVNSLFVKFKCPQKILDKTLEAPFCQVISQSHSLENSPTKMLSRVVYVMNFYLWILTFVMTILKFVC